MQNSAYFRDLRWRGRVAVCGGVPSGVPHRPPRLPGDGPCSTSDNKYMVSSINLFIPQ